MIEARGSRDFEGFDGDRNERSQGLLPLRRGQDHRAVCAGVGGELQLLLVHQDRLAATDGFDASKVEVRLFDNA